MNLCGKLRIDKFDFFGSNSIMARNKHKICDSSKFLNHNFLKYEIKFLISTNNWRFES